MKPSDKQQINEKIQELKSNLQKLTASTNWESSALLRRRKQAIEHLISKISELSSTMAQSSAHESSSAQSVSTLNNQLSPISPNSKIKRVYVFVYQVMGSDMNKWQVSLDALTSSCIGRPVYQEEKQIKQWLLSRGQKQTDGYVICDVNEDYFLSVTVKDNIGQPLISLSQGAITQDSIRRFVHSDGAVYNYIKGKLVLVAA
ncbi:MAG: type IVB secretion system protein IcmQ [Pseudomonadota bacterium]|nr:type IVB secretion system protein IcmQ [Pseudomonadota bacterium]